jgi:hypothetical protein
MNQKFNFIKNPKVENNILSGNSKLSAYENDIIVTFDIEDETNDINDFLEIVTIAKNFIDTLNKDGLSEIYAEVSKQITEASYSQSDYEPNEEDFTELRNDIKINQINFYEDDAVIILHAENVFKGMEITCQIDYDFEIDDVTIT